MDWQVGGCGWVDVGGWVWVGGSVCVGGRVGGVEWGFHPLHSITLRPASSERHAWKAFALCGKRAPSQWSDQKNADGVTRTDAACELRCAKALR